MNQMPPLAIISGARTPFAKAFTSLRDTSAVDLGCVAIADALRRAGCMPSEIDEVIFGNVSGPPDAANVARVIALQSEIPIDRIAHTVNRNCASGMEAILGGWHAVNESRADFVVAGGTESMSQVPLLFHPDAAGLWLRLSRAKTLGQRLKIVASFRPRHFKPVIGIELGLTDPVSGLNMGQTAELLAKEFDISRAEQDQFALESHQKAESAQDRCFLSGEIVATTSKTGAPVEKDNAVRRGQSLEQLAKLRPIFERNGTVTAGNSCPLTDGAAALTLTSVENSERFKSPLGYVTHYAVAGCAPDHMGLGPVYATSKLLQQSGLRMHDFELVEINEAFAAQVIACQRAFESKSFAQRELGRSDALGEISPETLNVHGGAIALGHPVGTTGTRLVLTLLRALRAAGKHRGLATLCVGGGQGVAMVVETELEK